VTDKTETNVQSFLFLTRCIIHRT